MSEPASNAVQIATDIPSDAAKVLRRKVYDAIDEAYDEKGKRYRAKLNGKFSDQSIADDVGCSPQLVEKIREEFFGPAGQSEPLEQIKALQIALSHLERDNIAIENLAKGVGQQVREHRQKISVVKGDLKRLCQDFGWAH